MTPLVSELKRQHNQIVSMLQEVKTLGIASDEGKKKLISAKNLLISHLKKEDAEFYPELKRMAKGDESVTSMVDFYTKDMESISAKAIEFFNTYENGGNGLKFSQDFGTLVGILSSRIKKEENILYQKFDELS